MRNSVGATRTALFCITIFVKASYLIRRREDHNPNVSPEFESHVKIPTFSLLTSHLLREIKVDNVGKASHGVTGESACSAPAFCPRPFTVRGAGLQLKADTPK